MYCDRCMFLKYMYVSKFDNGEVPTNNMKVIFPINDGNYYYGRFFPVFNGRDITDVDTANHFYFSTNLLWRYTNCSSIFYDNVSWNISLNEIPFFSNFLILHNNNTQHYDTNHGHSWLIIYVCVFILGIFGFNIMITYYKG